MPQVPYQGFPTERLQDLPLRPEVPAEITAGARALTRFGGKLEGAGDEIFREAMRLKQEENRALHDEAAAQYSTYIGEKHAQYETKLGQAAVEGLKPHVADMKAERERMEAALPNEQ